MPLHQIFNQPVFIHELQSVLLISVPAGKTIDIDSVQDIVNEVVRDRDEHEKAGRRDASKYHIQEPELGFDVFIRQGQELTLRSFDKEGKLIESHEPRSIDEEGLFHFQFAQPEKPLHRFQIGDKEFSLDQIKIKEFESWKEDKRAALIDEITAFNKEHFPEHFELWELNNKSPEIVKDHFAHLLSSLSSLYVIRGKDGEIAAINGISSTDDDQLAYQSMTITHKDHRGQGIMTAALAQATRDYPSAVMSAYFVNPEIRQSLGKAAMTQANRANPVPTEPNTYLNTKLAKITPLPAQSPLKERLQTMRLSEPPKSEAGDLPTPG